MYSFSNHIDLMISFISQKKRPVVLEFGVERGSSTKKFIEFAEKNSGKVFSVDIADCSNVSNSECWKFLQSNDLNVEHVIDTFNEIKNEGVDIIFIDSLHEADHVKKLICNYFKFLKQDGAIFVDDIDSLPLRLKKNIWGSIVSDLTLDAIKEFYNNNYDKCSLKIFYDKDENGLAMLSTNSKFGTQPNSVNKVWNYNIFFKIIYPLLKKGSKFIKSIFK